MRLHACSDRFENGRVFLPVNAPWLDDYVVELIGVPGTKHDDQVVSTTQALDHLREPDFLTTYLSPRGSLFRRTPEQARQAPVGLRPHTSARGLVRALFVRGQFAEDGQEQARRARGF
jgi:hypothetical protein